MSVAEERERQWERQNGESAKAFEAFTIYRDMGKDRTISATARQLGKNRTLIDRWKERWNWKERVRAYDNDLDQAAHEEALKNVREMQRRQIGIAIKIQQKAMEALNKINPAKMKDKDILAYLQMATKLERDTRIQIVKELEARSESDESSESEMPFTGEWESLYDGN